MDDEKRLILLPFKKVRGKLQPGAAVKAETLESAKRRAKLMASRFAGVAAIEFRYDELTQESFDVKIVHQVGEVPSADSLV